MSTCTLKICGESTAQFLYCTHVFGFIFNAYQPDVAHSLLSQHIHGIGYLTSSNNHILGVRLAVFDEYAEFDSAYSLIREVRLEVFNLNFGMLCPTRRRQIQHFFNEYSYPAHSLDIVYKIYPWNKEIILKCFNLFVTNSCSKTCCTCTPFFAEYFFVKSWRDQATVRLSKIRSAVQKFWFPVPTCAGRGQTMRANDTQVYSSIKLSNQTR